MKKILTVFVVIVVLFTVTTSTVNAQGSGSRQPSFFDNVRSGVTSFFSKASSTPTSNTLADLVVYSVTFDPKLGFPIITIKNQGNAKPASSSMVGFEWIKADGTGIGGIHMLWVGSNIAPGQTLAVNKAGQKYVSSWLPPSSATKVRITIDSQNQLKESKKDNNVQVVERSNTFTLTPASTQTPSDQGSGESAPSQSGSSGGGSSGGGGGSSGSFVDNVRNTVTSVISTITSKLPGSRSGDKDTKSPTPIPSVLRSASPAPNSTATFTPSPTGTGPTPTSTPPKALPDLKVDSLTFNPATNAPTVTISNIGSAPAVFKGTAAYVSYLCSNGTEWISCGSTDRFKNLSTLKDNLAPGENMAVTFGAPPDNVTQIQAEVSLFNGGQEKSTANNSSSKVNVPPKPTPTLLAIATPSATVSDSTSSATLESEQQQALQSLKYPIKELGDCKNLEDCQMYCDKPENVTACVNFGTKEKLMTKEEIEKAKKVSKIEGGPSGCNSKESCEKVCDDPANTSACLEFAQKNNLMSSDELEKAKRVMQIISAGTKTPGDCKTPKACREYCTGDGPHIKECIEFAKGAGLMSADEANQMEKGDFLKNGGPGGCKTREECEAYCEDDTHEEECRRFAPGEGKGDRGSKGPKMGGGAVCKTIEECKAFCQNPANAEACKNVVIKDSGSSGPETGGDLGALLGNINQMPQESKECLRQALGAETFDKLMKGEMPTTPISGDVMQSCFAKGVEEYEQKVMPTKKPDDFSLEYGPGPSSDYQANPGGVPEVQGTSTIRSLLNVVLDWFRR